jgi:LytS/YehU family sensor histidine kinase
MTLTLEGYVRQKGWTFSLVPLLINSGLMAFLVYGNILVLIPLLLEKKKIFLYISGIILLIILNTWLRSLVQQHWDAVAWPDELMTLSSYFKWNLFYAVWFMLISSMLFFTQKWSEQRQQVKNIQISQLQTELKYLRSQVNPHFLFNGLNTIYGNIDMQNQPARNILLQFADLLRYNLYEADVDWVDLEKETGYLENYVALQRARSDSNLQIELSIDIQNKSVKIAPLIFIAFVENAFKYSTRDDNRINTIKISLRQQGKQVVFECVNSYENDEPATGGIGLSNVKRRLELLYKDNYTLAIKKEQNIYSVQLILTV